MTVLCSVQGCWRPTNKRGMCSAHYRRSLKYGDPLGGPKAIRGEAMRFLRETAAAHKSEDCLLWPFCKSDNGYGVVTFMGRQEYAHRALCTLVNGDPPSVGMHAAHSCGKGHLGCVNPRHIRWATVRDNQLDRIDHGTAFLGEMASTAKLAEADVIAIRSSSGSVRRLADRYGVSPSQISRIRSKQRWAWLPDARDLIEQAIESEAAR